MIYFAFYYNDDLDVLGKVSLSTSTIESTTTQYLEPNRSLLLKDNIENYKK
jgi:hypothetical protein